MKTRIVLFYFLILMTGIGCEVENIEKPEPSSNNPIDSTSNPSSVSTEKLNEFEIENLQMIGLEDLGFGVDERKKKFRISGNYVNLTGVKITPAATIQFGDGASEQIDWYEDCRLLANKSGYFESMSYEHSYLNPGIYRVKVEANVHFLDSIIDTAITAEIEKDFEIQFDPKDYEFSNIFRITDIVGSLFPGDMISVYSVIGFYGNAGNVYIKPEGIIYFGDGISDTLSCPYQGISPNNSGYFVLEANHHTYSDAGIYKVRIEASASFPDTLITDVFEEDFEIY